MKTAAPYKGREQRRATPHAAAHTPDLGRFYRYRLPAQHPGAFEFLIDLLRKGLPPLSLDHATELLSWSDEQAVLTGSLTLRRPDPEDPRTLPVARGHRVRCRVRWDGGLYELWTMRAQAPQPQVDTGQVQVTLVDDMVLLQGGKREWIFRKTRRRPHGWTVGEITRFVAAELGVKVGAIVEGLHRFALVKRAASGLDVLRAALAVEKQHTGGAYIIRLRDGRLETVPLQRNPIVYILAGQIQTALITQKAGESTPTTILTGHGRVGHGHATRGVSYTAINRRVVSLLGAVRETRDYGRVGSHADLRAMVTRDYAKGLRVNDLITVQHQGIPFIQRGDGARIDLPGEGYQAADSFVYATRATHTVQAGVYTSEWDFTLTDPFGGKLTAFEKASAARKTKRTARARPKLVRGHAAAADLWDPVSFWEPHTTWLGAGSPSERVGGGIYGH